MLYNSRSIRSPDRTRPHVKPSPQTSPHRLLHAGLGHHGRCRLARGHGRLAAARRCSGRVAGLRHRWRAVVPHRLGLRQAGGRHARRRGRDRLHRGSFFPTHQLLHRMDDDARLLHRLPLGSRGRRPHRRLHHPRARFDRDLPHRRTPRLSPAPDHRSRPHRAAHYAELSWHPPQRDLPELDVLRHSGPVYRFCCARRKQRIAAQLPSALYSRARWFRSCSSCKSSRIS